MEKLEWYQAKYNKEKIVDCFSFIDIYDWIDKSIFHCFIGPILRQVLELENRAIALLTNGDILVFSIQKTK